MSNPIRRIVTGHSANGTAIFTEDKTYDTKIIPTGDAAMATLWTTTTVPADLNDLTEGRDRDAGTTIKNGSVIRIVDMLPNASSPMHRSSSIDYGIVLSGHIVLELDFGISKTIGPGEIIIQRGTIHKWTNPSKNEICRMVFVLTQAIPFTVDGQPLPDYMEQI